MPDFVAPTLDLHALAPEFVLAGVVCVLLLLDVVLLDRAKAIVGSIAGLGLLGSLVPILTLATSDHPTRTMFGGSYVVDSTSLLLKALFIVSAYVVVLLSTNYIGEGDYWESEYYTLLVSSVLGMTVMASARDLISIFVALELLSIPAYMLAAWSKRDGRSNEAGMKYYLMGVFASAILLYGMSLLYGWSGSTQLSEIGRAIGEKNSPAVTLGVVFVLVGFAFKVSAVPFHMWAPDTYEGAPTPVTAFLAVASKAAGFVALIQVIGQALVLRMNVMIPVVAVLAALSMTIGNLIALRQTNVIRMLAYSGIAQAGFMLAPFVASQYGGIDAIVIYLVLYAATNLGAFAVVMAIARRTRSAEISSFGGLFSYSPGLAVALSVFLASFVGIPPLGIWYGKLSVMRALIESQGRWATVLAIFVALNTAIAAYYYLNVAKTMWFDDAPEGESTPIKVPTSLRFAVGIALVATIALGVYPGPLTDAATPEATPAAAPSGR
ncbi:MAG: NADH-quinone oxidoreductase subunit N [Microthrixaceae bacterium]|nr:NADH-quinone oxidoreductase subunit N [Actinomycetota bacterium]MBP6729160.1 NADH-quinone oxidoreductase subunit N [Microthrixaceae bacterium]